MTNPVSHRDQLKRLNRARGQLEGIVRMIEDERHCVDILTQLRAARAALRAVESGILKSHVHHCIRHELRQGPADRSEQRIEELLRLLDRYG